MGELIIFPDNSQNHWEVRLVVDNNERLLARCREKRDCYREMTNFLVSQGIKKNKIMYHEHPVKNFLAVSSTDDFRFRLYNI